jgi:hypothetical protein
MNVLHPYGTLRLYFHAARIRFLAAVYTELESCTTVEGAGPANGCRAERPGCTNSGRTKTANGGPTTSLHCSIK